MVTSRCSFAERRTTVAAIVHSRSAAEFTTEYNQSLFEKSSIRQIRQQAIHKLIDFGQIILHPGLQIPMVIPTAEVTGDKRCTGLHKTSRQQSTLAPRMATIKFSGLRVFFCQVECFSRLCSCHHIERGAIKAVHGFKHAGGVGFATQAVD